ncbi:MAG TPA: ABC transporter permease [Acidimicrobiia bacterium]|jgi:peptide/nickel transport system permease protein|nr:ABC transporter permease [Acidimicrobiia bacterium]
MATPGISRRFASVVGELWKDKAGFFGLIVMSSLILVALAAPLLAPHDPAAQSLSDRLVPPFWLEGGSLDHPLGTDNLGRDVLSRIIFGSRVSLIVGLGVVLIAGTVGTVLGLLAGYNGGRVDTVIMRWLDTQLAFPGLLLYLVILSVVRPSLLVLIVILPINAWMVYALLVRGVVLSAKETPYVEAAEIVGARPRRIIFRHILPNLAAPLLTLAVLEFASAILAEAALSFLGLGIQPPAMSWGLDVAIGREYVFNAWWLVTFPGLAIALTVLGANLFASWLRIVADPHEREKRFAAGLGSTGGRGA